MKTVPYVRSLPLAKSVGTEQREGEAEVPFSATVAGHLRDVLTAAEKTLEHTAAAQLAALGLPNDPWEGRLRRCVRLAAAIHDLGKTNVEHFQRMIHASWERHSQALRHEWATLLALDGLHGVGGWGDWLRPAVESEQEWRVVRWAVAGHHPKYGRGAPPEIGEGPATLTLPLSHRDLRTIAGWLAETFGLDGLPPVDDLAFDLNPFGGDLDPLQEAHWADEDAFDAWDDAPDGEEWRRFVGAVKDTLVAADVAGSALARHDGADPLGWIDQVLAPNALPGAAAYREIVRYRLKPSAADPPADKAIDDRLRDFQRRTAESPARVTFLKAGCGTGKTLAAYRWAERRCERAGRGMRLFVCYPTTGTGTEGFRDYLADPELIRLAKESDSPLLTNLVHSRREADFAPDLELLENVAEDRNTAVARLESLETWRTPVVACTVDAVLGVIQNNRRGLFSWPVLAQAAFVFDEIHAYDAKLFDALLHFLEHVRGVPVLLMTASLPTGRLAAIKAVLRKTAAARGASAEDEFLTVPGDEPLSDLETIKTAPRYRPPPPPPENLPAQKKEAKAAKEAAFDAVKQELAGGRRALVVVNTVRRAMELTGPGGPLAGLSAELYHSRFKYEDRVKRHQRVVADFQQKEAPALAVCTQVAEMSLDLSATLLVTELAPVPALIQRLGRLNRGANPASPARFLVIEPESWDGTFSPLPYEPEEMKAALAWLALLRAEHGNGPLSQRQLAEAWQALDDSKPEARSSCAWLDGGPSTPVLELREGSPSMTVLLEEDVAGNDEPDVDVARLSLPMPVRPEAGLWQAKVDGDPKRPRTVKGVPVAAADAIVYCKTRGAVWADEADGSAKKPSVRKGGRS